MAFPRLSSANSESNSLSHSSSSSSSWKWQDIKCTDEDILNQKLCRKNVVCDDIWVCGRMFLEPSSL